MLHYNLGHLCQEVEWYPSKEDVCEVFNDTERSVHHPIGQPLRVVILIFRVDRLATRDREIEIDREVTRCIIHHSSYMQTCPSRQKFTESTGKHAPFIRLI